MRLFPTQARSLRTSSQRLNAIDNPYLAAALRSGRVRTPHPSILPARAERLGLIRGYYLRCTDGSNHWLGDTLTKAKANLPPARDRFLNRRRGYDGEVLYSPGPVQDGPVPWVNVSSMDHFIRT